MANSPNLRLEYIEANQSQKHVTAKQTYMADAWRDLLFNNFRHNDQADAAISSNVLTFTAPHDGYYLLGIGAKWETTGGSLPDNMRVGLSINSASPTEDRVGEVSGDDLMEIDFTQMTGLLSLSQGDTVEPKIYFTTNDGRVAADTNYFWGCQVA